MMVFAVFAVLLIDFFFEPLFSSFLMFFGLFF